MATWQEITLALGSMGAGGILLKMTESWLTRSKERSLQDKDLRDELRNEAINLRSEITILKEQLRLAEKELDDMRIKYWDVYTEYKIFKLHVQQILVTHGIDPKEFIDVE